MDISNFFGPLSTCQIEIYEAVNEKALSYDLKLETKYEIPFYTHKSWICYLNPIKKDCVEWAFVRANEYLEEVQSLLNFKKRKQVGGLEFYHLDQELLEIGDFVLQEAIILDQNTPYKSKRKKK